ncbi:hypothetical protein PQ472_00420 [Lacticaseibacillus pabuli]|uniref:Uncharacterized protein n=1 Tax=Lacticaseibacillus pabuli TaxID=3025672 RepID=A0ABY7WRC7_9LACO|nr:hypothetical protein [Lacticaseibacillus sp. KACC 23028]WDF82737.1 hypothetical protein PQ472_00420 [Lacticaseibacillus sp. KACC 23028]
MAGLLKYSDFENWREVNNVVTAAEKDVIKDVRRLSHVTYWGDRAKLDAFKVDHPSFFETNFRTLTYDAASKFYEDHNESGVSDLLNLDLILRVTKLLYRRNQFETLLDRVFYGVGYIQSWGYEIASVYLSTISEAVFLGIDGTQYQRFASEFADSANFDRVDNPSAFGPDNPFVVRISTSGDIPGLPEAGAMYAKPFDVDLDVTRWVPVPAELLVYHDRDGRPMRSASPTAAKTARQVRDAKNTVLRYKLGLSQ